MHRTRTVPYSVRLQYQLGKRRFVDLNEQDFHQLVELLLETMLRIFKKGPTYSPATTAFKVLLPVLLRVNKHSCQQVLEFLHRFDPDTGAAFCYLTNTCECCGKDRRITSYHHFLKLPVWDPYAQRNAEVRVCEACRNGEFILLVRRPGKDGKWYDFPNHSPKSESYYQALLHGNGLRGVGWRARFDYRITFPCDQKNGSLQHPMALDFVKTLGKQKDVLLFCPTTRARPRSAHLEACDVASLVASFKPGLDKLDAKLRKAKVKFIKYTIDEMREQFKRDGVICNFLSPKVTPEEVDEIRNRPQTLQGPGPFWGHRLANRYGHWESKRLELASRFYQVFLDTDQENWYTEYENLWDDFVDAICRMHLHPSFIWVCGGISRERDLIMCRRLQSGWLRVNRICTTRWYNEIRETPDFWLVVLGIQLPASNEQFTFRAKLAHVEALGLRMEDEGKWKSIPADRLFAFNEIVTDGAEADCRRCFWSWKIDNAFKKRKRPPLDCNRCYHCSPPRTRG